MACEYSFDGGKTFISKEEFVKQLAEGKLDEFINEGVVKLGNIRSDGKVELTEEQEVKQVAEKIGITPKNLKDLYDINRKLFGLDRLKSLAAAITMDRMIGVMAKRANISKAEMYSRLNFEKASEQDLPQGVKFQVDAWHGSPYEFDKFTTQKIGTGEGAQAFGWGLYFTDLESIARNYANKLLPKSLEYYIGEYYIRGVDVAEDISTYIRNGGTIQEWISKTEKALEKNKILEKEVGSFKGTTKEGIVNGLEKQIEAAKKLEKKVGKNIYKVSLHEGKTPEQYTWLEWDRKTNKNQVRDLLSKLTQEQMDNGFYYGLSGVETNGDLYNRLKRAFKSDKEASLFLLNNGIDGIKYPAESVARGATSDNARGFNYVVFDENAVSIKEVIKFQKDANKSRGAVMVSMDGQATIYALTDPNVSTPVHELAHVFEHYLTPEERQEVIKSAGTQGWTIETSERFARGFERYLANGNAPTEGLKKVFQKFKQWLTDIYNGIKDSEIDIELNPKMEEIYAKMLGEDAVKKKQTPPPPKTPTTQKEGEEGDANLVALEHAATEEKRAAYGMEGRTLREVKKDEQLEAEANEAIRNGYDVKGLIKRITNKDHLPTDKEHIILLKYAAGLESKLEGLDPKSKEFEDIFTELNATYKASEVGGSELGAAFRARQSRVLQEDALGEMLVREAEVNRVEELTPEQRENVVKEYEAIKKAKEEWEAKYNELQNQQLQKDAELEVQKAKRTSSGKKKTKEDFTKERQSIKDAIKDKWKKAANDGTLMAIPVPYAKQLAAISPDVAKLMKSYVEEGITDLGEIVSKIKEDVQDFVEGVTEKDIRDIIAGVYNEKRTKNQIASDLRDLRDEAKLLNQLEALENGEIPKTEKAKIERNQKITDLRNRIKELKKELIGGKTIDGEPIDKKLKSIKIRLEKQIQELEEKLSKGDYSKEEKKPPIKLDKEAQELKDKLIKLKQEREIRLLQQEYANRTKAQKAKDLGVEILNVPRTIMASIDFSAPLRQGIIATISYPKVSMEAFVEMFKQAVSQKRFDRWFYDLRESPEYEVMEKAGLYIADPHDPKLSAKEEQFMNNLAEKIPFVGKLIKGSERAYVSYLNKMRADLFVKGMESFEVEGKTIKNSPELYESLASFINNATGRGKMAKTLEDGAPILNAAFFSPRLMASRINLMNPAYYANLSPEIRKMAMRDMSKFLAFGTSLLILAALAGADIEKDPRSPNFMKIKVGDTTYDIWGGFQQYIVELTQLLRGETKSASTGEIRSLSGKEFPFRTRGEDLQGFVRGKLAPVPAATMNLLTGKKVTGERTSLGKEVGGLLLPLNAKDAYQAFSEQGVLGGLSTLVPATFGIGVQSMSNIPEAADAKKPEWKYISEKKARVPQPDLETMKVGEEDREMTKEEVEKFVELRTKKLESFISKILNKGLYVVNEKGVEVYKPSKDLTKEVLDEELKRASKRITAEVKEEMFGKEEEKPDKAKERAKDKNEKLLKD